MTKSNTNSSHHLTFSSSVRRLGQYRAAVENATHPQVARMSSRPTTCHRFSEICELVLAAASWLPTLAGQCSDFTFVFLLPCFLPSIDLIVVVDIVYCCAVAGRC